MFEKTASTQSAFAPGIMAPGAADSQAGESLRMIGWDELSARIKAARDLRRELKRAVDNSPAVEPQVEGTVAQQFTPLKDHERCVNRDDLDGRKAWSAISLSIEGGTATGEKENIDD